LRALLLLCFWVALAWLPQPAAADSAGATVEQEAQALIAAKGFPGNQVGYLVFDLADGTILTQHNADTAYIPASVQKVPTALYGLEHLGPQHRFTTQLLTDGRIAGGALSGNLYLKGGGDPFLTNEDLLELVRRLKGAGIGRIEGRFFYDESALPVLTELNPDQPRAVSYNPGLSALNLNFNVVDIAWAREKDSGALAANALATSADLKVPANEIAIAMLPSSRGKQVPYLPTMQPDGEAWLLSPELPIKGHARVPVKRPALNAANVFRQLAAQEGLILPKPAPGVAPTTSRALAGHESVPLSEAIRLILRYSNNLAAELVALVAASWQGQPTSSLRETGQRITAWIGQRIPQGDWRGMRLDNGSGLSSLSRMTARQMATILFYGYSLHRQGLDFAQLLSRARWESQLAKLRKKEKAPGLAVRGKSGTIYFSRAYAGYLDSRSGRHLGFALFISDLDQRRLYDQALNIDQVSAPPGAAAWMKRARKLERELISLWLVSY